MAEKCEKIMQIFAHVKKKQYLCTLFRRARANTYAHAYMEAVAGEVKLTVKINNIINQKSLRCLQFNN